jgi:TonB family protein
MKNLPRFQLVIATAALAFAPGLFAQKTAPKPVTFPSPKYPTELVDTGLGGQATVDVLVKADGSVADPQLKAADNPAFGTEAMAVIGQWTFNPGTRDGAPIDMRVAIPFQFRAPFDQKINAMAKRKVYMTLPEPALTEKEYKAKLKPKSKASPIYPAALVKSGVKQDVKINFVVTPQGTVINPQFEQELKDPQFILPSIAAISKVTYEPPLKDKKGVYVATSATLHFEEPPPGEKGRGGRKGGNGGADGGEPPAGDP